MLANRRPTFSKKLTVYRPDRDRHGGVIADIEHWISEAARLMATINGGVTRLAPAQGIWHSENDGRFIEETTHILYSYTDPRSMAERFPALETFINRFIVATNQETVAIEYADEMYLIGGIAEAKHLSLAS